MDIEYTKISKAEIDEVYSFLDKVKMNVWNFKINPEFCFVAKNYGKIVSVSAGNLSKDKVTGVNGVAATLPEYQKKGIVVKLTRMKLNSLKEAGAKIVIADAVNPAVTKYLMRDFGYKLQGSRSVVVEGQPVKVDRLIWWP